MYGKKKGYSMKKAMKDMDKRMERGMRKMKGGRKSR